MVEVGLPAACPRSGASAINVSAFNMDLVPMTLAPESDLKTSKSDFKTIQSDPKTVVTPLHSEELLIERRTVETGQVQVHLRTTNREQPVDEMLTRERVEIERVPVGRIVDVAPAVREEGDTTVIPVVEETLVVERRLILKEEIRLTRVRTTERHRESVTLREQEAVIDRPA